MILPTVRALTVLGIACATAIYTNAAETDGDPMTKWDYATAMAAAERDNSLMVVYFHDEDDPLCRRFDEHVARTATVRDYLAQCRCARLSVDAEITSDGEAMRLLDHPAFADLQGGPGLIVFDFTIQEVDKRGCVLQTLPFRDDHTPGDRELAFLAPQLEKKPAPVEPFQWMTGYAEAAAKAEREGRMLLIYFEKPDGCGECAQFEAETLSAPQVRDALSSYVCIKLPHDAKVNFEDTETVLLRHPSFSEMVGLPGVAIVDFTNPKAPYFGQVVSTFPFLHGKAYNPEQMGVILDLPPGKLTQRTLIYAVRTHPDAPQSTSGELDLYLLSEAESHSAHQAEIRLQGHHSWDSRFHRINRRLRGGLLACEVCAESWPGQNLLEAAIDCVHCWRQSSGHWKSVRTAHPVFGYDIRRGSNGIWYATGIFGKRGH